MEPFISLSTDVIVIAEDFYEITYIRGMGKFTNSSADIVEDEPLNPEFQLGGFKYYETMEPNKKFNNDVTIDISIRQMTWTLLTNVLISDGINNINKNKILDYISEREKEENKNALDSNNSSRKRSLLSLSGGGDENHLYENHLNENDLMTILNSFSNFGKDNKKINFGYHPLVPLYMILSSFWYSINPNLSNDCFYDSFIDYFYSIDKMTNVIIQNYLNNNLYSQAYFIGFALKIFFFQSYTSVEMVNGIIEILNVDPYSYQLYSLKNDMFGNYIAGYFFVDSSEEQFNNTLLFSDLFKNFLVKEVNLSSFVDVNGGNSHGLSIDEFQEKIYLLLKKIVEQIEKDENMDYPEDSNNSNKINIRLQQPPLSSSSLNKKTRKSIDKQGNILDLPITSPKKGIYSLNDFPNSSSSLTDSNSNSLVYNSSSTNSNYGGKKSNSKKNKKTYKTYKTFKIHKTLKNKKTLKTHKSYKKHKTYKKQKTYKK